MIIKSDSSKVANICKQHNSEFVDRQIAAEFLGFKIQTLAAWASAKRHSLPYYKIGRRVRYKVSDLIMFLENGRVEE